MNPYRPTLLLNILLYIGLPGLLLPLDSSCTGQQAGHTPQPAAHTSALPAGDTVSRLGKNICSILHDRNNHFWYASNGEGLYHYNGHTLRHFTTQHGLLSNFVLSVEQHPNGRLFFVTRDGVCTLQSDTFADCTPQMNDAPFGPLRYTPGGLFFTRPHGLCYYNGDSFTTFSIEPASAGPALPDFNRPYSIYSTLADKEGNIWFGTQEKGVCCYNGNTFTYYTENGLDKAAVRTLFQHRDGTLWAGNNGAGLFRFNGKTFDNFTEAHHLGNPEFLAKLPPREGTLGRPWTLEQDSAGLLWIGTIDAGVWTFDGTQLTHYTTQHGLAGNSIWKIYKDNTGAFWFIANGEALCRFNGQRFSTFVF